MDKLDARGKRMTKRVGVLSLYRRYFAIHLKSQMQYKASFFLSCLSQFLASFVALFAVYFLFDRFHQVEGFSFHEVLLCFAVVAMAFSLAECFARGFDLFPLMLGNGEFDRILVRPRGAILQVLASKMEFTRISRLAQSLLIFAYALPASGVVWRADKVLTLVLMTAAGTVVFSGIFVIYASLCFFTTQGLEIINIFTNGGLEFGRYPLAIYGEGILKFFTYVIPMALFQYYPLLYLVGRTDNRLYMLTPFLACLFLIPCLLLWKAGVRHYRSTGS